MQPKLPAYLGGVSVVISFMASAVALLLSLSIVPRQVTPWTGLLLMYEWTFTIVFLSYGGYLHLIYQWGKTKTGLGGSVSPHSESFGYSSGKG